MKWYSLYAARAFMSIRECWVTDRRRESQEEVVADLHSCLEQLTFRCAEMESKIEKSKQRALYHMKLSKKETLQAGIVREKARARMYMQDRTRLQDEHDKALKSMHMLQQQIDSIVSSHVDMAIVDAMRGFNATAAKLGLPQKAAEIEKLSESLADRQNEAACIHEAMSGITALSPQQDTSEDGLMDELEQLMMMSEPAVIVQEEPLVVMMLPSVPVRTPLSPKAVVVVEEAAIPEALITVISSHTFAS